MIIRSSVSFLTSNKHTISYSFLYLPRKPENLQLASIGSHLDFQWSKVPCFNSSARHLPAWNWRMISTRKMTMSYVLIVVHFYQMFPHLFNTSCSMVFDEPWKQSEAQVSELFAANLGWKHLIIGSHRCWRLFSIESHVWLFQSDYYPSELGEIVRCFVRND